MRANDTKPIGLTLDQEYYDRLKAFADSRHWTMALAARLIVKERLDSDGVIPSGLIRGTSRETGADGP